MQFLYVGNWFALVQFLNIGNFGYFILSAIISCQDWFLPGAMFLKVCWLLWYFMQQRHEVPQNFRRLLSSKLRRLVAQNKIERVNSCSKCQSHFLIVWYHIWWHTFYMQIITLITIYVCMKWLYNSSCEAQNDDFLCCEMSNKFFCKW